MSPNSLKYLQNFAHPRPWTAPRYWGCGGSGGNLGVWKLRKIGGALGCDRGWVVVGCGQTSALHLSAPPQRSTSALHLSAPPQRSTSAHPLERARPPQRTYTTPTPLRRLLGGAGVRWGGAGVHPHPLHYRRGGGVGCGGAGALGWRKALAGVRSAGVGVRVRGWCRRSERLNLCSTERPQNGLDPSLNNS